MLPNSITPMNALGPEGSTLDPIPSARNPKKLIWEIEKQTAKR